MQAINVKPRLQKLRQMMAHQQYEAFLITNEANVTYLSGYTNHDSFLFISNTAGSQANIFLTDFRYIEQAAAECPDYEIKLYRNGSATLAQAIAQLCAAYGVKRLAFEREHISFALYDEVRQPLKGIELCPASGLPESLRYIKDEAETERLRAACAATDRVFQAICAYLQPGLTERAVEWQLLSLIRAEGCEPSFPSIVVSGPRGSLPHGVPSEKPLQTGEFVTLDFGCKYQGYCGDMTRTVFLGQPTAEQRGFYEIVREANQLAEAAIRPGLKATAVDAVARDYIAAQGYGQYFGHGLGHGVGLDIHEAPFLNTTADDILAAGCFVTVEPGIYLPGRYGVRVEDTVLVTDQGAEPLFCATKELICL